MFLLIHFCIWILFWVCFSFLYFTAPVKKIKIEINDKIPGPPRVPWHGRFWVWTLHSSLSNYIDLLGRSRSPAFPYFISQTGSSDSDRIWNPRFDLLVNGFWFLLSLKWFLMRLAISEWGFVKWCWWWFFGRFGSYGGFAVENWRRRLWWLWYEKERSLEREMLRRKRELLRIFFFF